MVLPDVIPNQQAKTFNVYTISDPANSTAWVLSTPFKMKAATITAIYRDRWSAEQLPLSAK